MSKLYTIEDIKGLTLTELLETLNAKQLKIEKAKSEFDRFVTLIKTRKRDNTNEFLQCSLSNIRFLDEEEIEYIATTYGESIGFTDIFSDERAESYKDEYHRLKDHLNHK